jgi:serine-type D-Ala-D-Ala carboxypeptidase/endopeptidase (penicillin-binding protein 4)
MLSLLPAFRVLLVVGISALAAQAQPAAPDRDRLARAIDEVLADTAFVDAFWGLHVMDLSTGETLYARGATNNFIPASNMKMLTTAAVLDALGPDFRYTTELFVQGDRRGTILDGDLVIRGSGDPTISDRLFQQHYPTDGDPHAVLRSWADSLRTSGITHVSGNVIADDRYFDDALLGRGWAWDDEPTVFAAQISALSFNEGRLTLTATGTAPGQRARVRIEPETDYIYVINRSETVRTGAESQIRREQGNNTVWLESRVPAGESISRSISVHNPARYFAHTFRDQLRSTGLGVDGDPVVASEWWRGLDYRVMTRVATYTSPPMAELAAVTNKISQNLYAEHLLRTLGAERCAQARALASERRRNPERIRCGSAEAGLLAAEPLFERAGMRTDRMRLVDGSGMSHYNMLSPADVTALLSYMWSHSDDRVRAVYVASMAVGGVDGTLRRRFTSGPATNRVFAKTGTVTGARNLSGYVTTHSGRPLAFAILTNLYGTSLGTVTRAQDTIVEILARQ